MTSTRMVLAELPLALVADFWTPEGRSILLTAAVTSSACALLGSYLVLRRMSLMGDALSHAVLPGLAIAFILSKSYSIGPLLIGAAAAGLLTTFLTQTLHQYARVPSDASMGVVFTALFALGVVLIHKGIRGVHFDTCIYQGALEYVPWYETQLLGYTLPRTLVATGFVLLLNAAVVTLLWKELKISSFDPQLATTMGFNASLMHYLLMALVAVTAVASFEAVGSILVVAMLIIPPATAHLLADRLGLMVALAVVAATLSAILGYIGGIWFNANYAGMMTVAAGSLYGLAVLFSPRYGVVSTIVRNVQTSLRVVREDILAMLFRAEELRPSRRLARAAVQTAVGGGLLARWGLRGLAADGHASLSQNEVGLTAKGRDAARQLVRSHRLWESYLVKYLDMPADHVHEPAHRVEHYIGPELRDELQEKLPAADTDPHGRRIPE